MQDKKIIIYTPGGFDHCIAEISSVLVSCYFSDRSESMSSQDSVGESHVSHVAANPRAYDDEDHHGWSIDGEIEANLKRLDSRE